MFIQLILCSLCFISCVQASIFDPFYFQSTFHQIGTIDVQEFKKNLEEPSVDEGDSTKELVDIVNPITGICGGTETDYTLPGPIPFDIQRFHNNISVFNTSFAGWHFFSDHIAYVVFDSDHVLYAYEPSGTLMAYVTTEKNKYFNSALRIASKRFRKGYVNSFSGEISGASNRKNQTALFPSNREIYVIEADGTKRIYTPHNKKEKFEVTTICQQCVLREIIKPSGHRIKFDRRIENDDCILTCKTTNPSSTKVFSSVDISFHLHPNKVTDNYFTVKGCDGRSFEYLLHRNKTKDQFFLCTKVKGRDGVDVSYEYNKDPICVRKKVLPDGRFFEIIHHYQRKKLFPNSPSSNPPEKGYESNNSSAKIALQIAPMNEGEPPVFTQRYSYYDAKDGSGGYTEVFDALNNMTKYRYTKTRRISSIERYLSDGSLYHSENTVWEESEDSKNHARLLMRYFKDAGGAIISARTFKYDDVGNVLEESVFGNITGNCTASIELDKKKNVRENGVQHTTKVFTYSNDQFHLKLSECSKKDVVTYYTYLPGTNLPASEILTVNGVIKERLFYFYDEDHLLKTKIIDDGSSDVPSDLTNVTERHIIQISSVQAGPGCGMPEVTAEYYYDVAAEREVLLSKKINHYLPNYCVGSTDFYDGQENYCYTLNYTYDEKNRLISESDPLGNVTYYRYDSCGNKIYESSRPDVYRVYDYDLGNRNTEIREYHADGSVFTTKNKYNYLGQKIETQDTFGSVQLFEYDPFDHLTKVTSLDVIDENGATVPSIVSKKYDALGRVIEEVDPRGYKTSIEYNLEGKPIHVEYPDGTEERFEYNLSGTLQKAYLKNGAVIQYEYDYRDREILRQVFGQDGTLIKTHSKRYNSFRLIQETDETGQTIEHTYDGAGRLIASMTPHSKVTYAYDALGELCKKVEWASQNNFIAANTVRNQLGQIIEESVEGPEGIQKRELYTYDKFGNKCETITITDAPQSWKTLYNSLNEPITTIDPLGYETHISYTRNKALQICSTDPLENQLITLYDNQSRISSIESRNKSGQVTSYKEFRYDLSGNKARCVEYVYLDGQQINRIETAWVYGPMKCLEQEIEAYGSPSERVVRFEYNALGLLIKKIDSAGIELNYEYDAVGRCTRQYSSGSSAISPIDYRFTYDEYDLPVVVEDQLNGRATYLTFNTQGYLQDETLASGLKLFYTYDNLGRCISITLPDNSSVQVDYVGAFSKRIKRYSAEGKLLYAESYLDRNLSGKVTRAETPLGEKRYSWNSLGLLKTIKAPNFQETIDLYDAVGNVLQKTTNSIVTNYVYDDLYQIVRESGLTPYNYSCDSLNNLRKVNATEYTLNDLNQVELAGDCACVYDLSGNLVQKGDQTFRYDALNRLIEVKDSSGILVTYTYDASNRRISKKDSSGTIYFLYQGNHEIGACDENGTLLEFRVLGEGLGAEVGAAIAFEINGEVFIPIHDHRGSLAQLSNFSTGSTIESYHLNAFGILKIFDADGSQLKEASVPWIFSSKRLDQETGLIFFGCRYYDPEFGRWITRDPSGFSDGPNLYAFVHNNPLKNIDLFGLSGYNDRHFPTRDQKRSSFKPNFRFDGSKGENTIQRAYEFCRSLIGRTVRRTGVELPIPYVRLGVQALGWFIERGSFTPPDRPLHDHSQMIRVGEKEANGEILSFINGICNDYKDAKQTALEISAANGGAFVYLIYNSTHGTLLDLSECVASIIGIPTHASEVAEKSLRDLSQMAKATNSRCIHLAHSQGVLLTSGALDRLNYNERRFIHVKTFGGAHMIINDQAASVVNFVNPMDFVPWVGDFPGMLRAYFGHGIHLHQTNSWIPLDHGVLGTYGNVWKNDAARTMRAYR